MEDKSATVNPVVYTIIFTLMFAAFGWYFFGGWIFALSFGLLGYSVGYAIQLEKDKKENEEEE